MPSTLMRVRAGAVAAPVLLSIAVGGLTTPAHTQEPGDAPQVQKVTTANESGGLTPYIPLYSTGVVTFTDSTPSAADDYRVRLGKKDGSGHVQALGGGRFRATFDVYSLENGRSYPVTVQEVGAGGVTATSAPVDWTFRYVRHPRKFVTSSTKVKGQWTYRAGKRATFRFKGTWEPGTRVSTQVWVSKRKKFTPDDWSANVYGKAALLEAKPKAKPVLSVKIPRKVVGKYVWVSVLGWKDGTAGWTFSTPAAKVVRR
ncbi:hypothetical protein [Nocardioides caldifontis]|uniref:hypothetical protein n=1 Tax=Nocardioides caldifontis TaxID=2588938 RepID=UPI0011DFA615|nr:hypothetical protein [Nocardioides caldifontis]